MKKTSSKPMIKSEEQLHFSHFVVESLGGQAKYSPTPHYVILGWIACIACLFCIAVLGPTISQPFSISASMETGIGQTEQWQWRDAKESLLPFLKRLANAVITLAALILFWAFCFWIMGHKIHWSDMFVVIGICGIPIAIGILACYGLSKAALLWSWVSWVHSMRILSMVAVAIASMTSLILLYVTIYSILGCKGRSRYYLTIGSAIFILFVSTMIQQYILR